VVYCVVPFIVVLLAGCANQQPPGGGEEDKDAPKVLYQNPRKNTLNYKGTSIVIEFDEYVDRRSFQDAFKIFPHQKGEISYDWSGKEVEVILPDLRRKKKEDKTYVVNIGSNLKDIHGNSIKEPIQFAFSTGPQIDKAGISGRVANSDGKSITIFAYKLTSNESDYDPTKNSADYITETNPEGSYMLTNLAPGEYRVIAVFDDDRNLLYTSERENYGVLTKDMILKDSLQIGNVDFFIKHLEQKKGSADLPDIENFFKDSLDIVYSSVDNNSRNVLPEQSIYIMFNKAMPSRAEFVNSFSVRDENNLDEKVVFNWHNDSLVEIFAPGKFGMNKTYRLSFNIKTGKDSSYNYLLKFKTAGSNSFGEITGIVKGNLKAAGESYPVIIDLLSSEKDRRIKYSITASDTVFMIDHVLEGDYTLFSYIDLNLNGEYDFGNPFPLTYSEPFYLYPEELSVKGGWAVENLIIDFTTYNEQ
jgi:hypothetical protein